jgi:hypothetical protein
MLHEASLVNLLDVSQDSLSFEVHQSLLLDPLLLLDDDEITG